MLKPRRYPCVNAKVFRLFIILVTTPAVFAVSSMLATRYGANEVAAGPQKARNSNAFLERRPFVHIPGPNPILMSGTEGSWDEGIVEQADVIKDFNTYYMYYHGAPSDKKKWGNVGYQIGLATASNPLGPWTKYGDEPLLGVGPAGSWDDLHVACATVLREAPDKYLMFYCGKKDEKISRPSGNYSIGLATASKPTGPWTRYNKNPIIPFFGYVSSVVRANEKYYLFSAYPVALRADDYSPMSVAIADKPEGPWTILKENPIFPLNEIGAWDDAGYSEGKVTLWEGVFHMFYGGGKEYKPRINTRESIGYAYSFDGLHFTRYGGNPVAAWETNPNAAAFAEVRTLFEPPFIYAYHTLRYIDPAQVPFAKQRTHAIEHIGVQILASQTPFRLAMPVITLESLAGGTSTAIGDCPPISIQTVTQVSLTAECAYKRDARAGMRVHVLSSYDGVSYDTSYLFSFDNDISPGSVGRRTVELNAKVRFFKVLIENLDKDNSLSKIKVTATLGG